MVKYYMKSPESIYGIHIGELCRRWIRRTFNVDTSPGSVEAAEAFIVEVERQGPNQWLRQYYAYGTIDYNKLHIDLVGFWTVWLEQQKPHFTQADAAELLQNGLWPVIRLLDDIDDLEDACNAVVKWGVVIMDFASGRWETTIHSVCNDITESVAEFVNEHLGGDPENLDTCESVVVVQIVDTLGM